MKHDGAGREVQPEVPKRGRGRPRKSSIEESLDAAMRVFWAKGYEATSMSDLTDAMGLGRPSFYARFESKHDLFLQVLDRYGATIGAEPIRAMEREAPGEAGVHAFLETSLLNNTQPSHPTGCLYACAASTSAGEVEGVRERLAKAGDAARERLMDRAFTGMATDDARAKADLAVDLMNAQALRARAGATRKELLASLPVRVKAVMKARHEVQSDRSGTRA